MADPRDLHRQRAARIFGIPVEKVTPKQREYAKKITFVERYSLQGVTKGKR